MSSAGKPLRLGVLLSGTGRTLDNLLKWQARGALAASIACVASNRAAVRGLEVAAGADLPLASFKLSAHDDRAQRDAALAGWVVDHKCDLVVLAGYLALLDTTAFSGLPILNIHPALLPRHGGEGCWGHHVHEAVLAAGEAESGCSVHLVDEQFDQGRVLAQRRVPVLAGDTVDSLSARVFEAECELYPETINRIASGELDPGAGVSQGRNA